MNWPNVRPFQIKPRRNLCVSPSPPLPLQRSRQTPCPPQAAGCQPELNFPEPSWCPFWPQGRGQAESSTETGNVSSELNAEALTSQLRGAFLTLLEGLGSLMISGCERKGSAFQKNNVQVHVRDKAMCFRITIFKCLEKIYSRRGRWIIFKGLWKPFLYNWSCLKSNCLFHDLGHSSVRCMQEGNSYLDPELGNYDPGLLSFAPIVLFIFFLSFPPKFIKDLLCSTLYAESWGNRVGLIAEPSWAYHLFI